MTVWHLRDLASGKRTIVKCTAVKTLHIPFFEGLTVERMLAHAMKTPHVAKALPIEEKEIFKLPREYIGNVLFTLVGDRFKKWVESKIEDRNQKM